MMNTISARNRLDTCHQVKRPYLSSLLFREKEIIFIEGILGTCSATDVAFSQLRTKPLFNTVLINEHATLRYIGLFVEVILELRVKRDCYGREAKPFLLVQILCRLVHQFDARAPLI